MANPLNNYAWKKRPIIVFAPSEDDKFLLKQRANLWPHLEALEERDIVIIEIRRGTVHFVLGESVTLRAGELRRHVALMENRFGIVLIGKDTSVKLRRAKPVTARALFDLIDSMPMRQQEMAN
ncbi:MAG: DUF4174 domain-containing protein [Hyphomicrobiales bacterium]